VVPILVAIFLGVVLFGAAFAFLNFVLPDDSLPVGVANFVLLIVAAGLGVRILFILIGRLFTRYTLTSKHLVVKRGILSRSRKTIPIKCIQDVAVSQSFIERPFGIGDLVVESAGERGGAVLYDLPNVGEVHDIILRAMDTEGGRV
jgi:uncharacterized membrane protein YdbT with pleckstrin-like domain